MWYREAVTYNLLGQLTEGNPKKKIIKQFVDDEIDDLNIEDQQDEQTEEPIQEEPEFTPVPTNIPPATDTPAGVANREPIKVQLPANFKVPPLHEFCHCEINTLPSGRQIWKLGNGEMHCSECVMNRDLFNRSNELAYRNIT